MSKQKNILNFFKPVASKRVLAEANFSEQKKIKEDDTVNTSYYEKALVKLKPLHEKFPIIDTEMGPSWFFALEKEFSEPYFKELNDFYIRERARYTIYPPEEHIWSWTKLCRLQDVKVVVLGQDPYHNPKQAHGLCFSVPKGVHPPPSLLNMYKELESDIENFTRPPHGDLTHWAKQGVLLLNACLTVRKNEPNSHADHGWERITDAVIREISNKNKGTVFLLWGAYAQKKAALVSKEKHHLLKAPHPSPFSAAKGFFGCKHFSRCNQFLIEEGKEPVNWKFP